MHPNVRAVVFATTHRVPSQGYMLIRDKSKGLKVRYTLPCPRSLLWLRVVTFIKVLMIGVVGLYGCRVISPSTVTWPHGSWEHCGSRVYR